MTLDAPLAAKATFTGNPVRPTVIAAAAQPYAAPDAGGPFRLLVTGGSQGARVMADIVPPAIEQMRRRSARAAAHRAAGARRGRDARRGGLRAARRHGRGRAVLLRPAGAHRGGASGRVALRRLDGRRACGDRAAGDPGAAAARARPGPAGQRQRAGARPAARSCSTQDDFTPERLAGEIAGARGRSRAGSPRWRPARSPPACSTPRNGSPIWCCAWRMWYRLRAESVRRAASRVQRGNP